MNRARLASVLVVAWSGVQAWSLLLLRFYPAQHMTGWILCAMFLAIAVGLWLAKPWARVLFLAVGSGFVVFYAAGFFLTDLPCAKESSSCNVPLLLSQPVLMIAALAILFRPMTSNRTIERDAPQAGRPSL